MSKNIFLLLVLVTFYCYGARANPFNTKSLMVKGPQWIVQNQSFLPLKEMRSSDVQYERLDLMLRILEIIQTERPFGAQAFQVIKSLISQSVSFNWNHFSHLVSTIQSLELKESEKDELKRILRLKTLPAPVMESDVPRKAEVNIAQVLSGARAAIVKMPLPSGLDRDLLGGLDTVKKILLDNIPADDCYNTSAGCQFGSNRGIIHYFSSRIHQNHALALAVLKAGIRIQKLNRQHAELLAKGPLHHEKFKLNLWPMLLEVSENDPALALEVLSVFGHDVTNNGLLARDQNPFLTTILNLMRPSGYGTDANPASVFFLPGALNGIVPTQRISKRVDKALIEYEKAFGKRVTLRHGYHHIYGGALIAQELLASGFGRIGALDQASLISQVMGYAYKKLQLIRYLGKDSAYLWKEMGENEFARIKKPSEWDADKFLKAKAELKLHLAIMAYTEHQHYLGARFAVKTYQRRLDE